MNGGRRKRKEIKKEGMDGRDKERKEDEQVERKKYMKKSWKIRVGKMGGRI